MARTTALQSALTAMVALSLGACAVENDLNPTQGSADDAPSADTSEMQDAEGDDTRADLLAMGAGKISVITDAATDLTSEDALDAARYADAAADPDPDGDGVADAIMPCPVMSLEGDEATYTGTGCVHFNGPILTGEIRVDDAEDLGLDYYEAAVGDDWDDGERAKVTFDEWSESNGRQTSSWDGEIVVERDQRTDLSGTRSMSSEERLTRLAVDTEDTQGELLMLVVSNCVETAERDGARDSQCRSEGVVIIDGYGSVEVEAEWGDVGGEPYGYVIMTGVQELRVELYPASQTGCSEVLVDAYPGPVVCG